MIRSQRQAHRLIWPLLAVALAVLFVAALIVRPSAPPPTTIGLEEASP